MRSFLRLIFIWIFFVAISFPLSAILAIYWAASQPPIDVVVQRGQAVTDPEEQRLAMLFWGPIVVATLYGTIRAVLSLSWAEKLARRIPLYRFIDGSAEDAQEYLSKLSMTQASFVAFLADVVPMALVGLVVGFVGSEFGSNRSGLVAPPGAPTYALAFIGAQLGPITGAIGGAITGAILFASRRVHK